MFERVQAFIARIKEARAGLEVDEGFAWAMVSYYRNNKSLDEIKDFAEQARNLGTYNCFDHGVELAIIQIETSNEMFNKFAAYEQVYVVLKDDAGSPDETFVEIETASGRSVSVGSRNKGERRFVGPLYKKIKS